MGLPGSLFEDPLKPFWGAAGGIREPFGRLFGFGGTLGRHAGWEDRVVVRASYVLAVLEASWAILGGRVKLLEAILKTF